MFPVDANIKIGNLLTKTFLGDIFFNVFIKYEIAFNFLPLVL